MKPYLIWGNPLIPFSGPSCRIPPPARTGRCTCGTTNCTISYAPCLRRRVRLIPSAC